MIVVGLLLAAAFADQGAAAPRQVGAVIEPSDVVEQYRLHAAERGLQGRDRELLCRPGAEGLQVCATVLGAGVWRYATYADEDVKAPTASVEGKTQGFEKKTVKGVGEYWVRAENDGREGLFYVQPGLLEAVSTVPLVVAWPQPGVVLAWVPGNPSLDQILSVGVAKMAAETSHPISSMVYRQVDGEWTVWGEAKAGEDGL